MLFVKLLSDGKAAVQAAIARENFPTSPHGDGTDENIDRAGLNARVSAFVVDERRVLVIGGVDRLVEIWVECGFHFVELLLFRLAVPVKAFPLPRQMSLDS
jgi:hypothetical protein